MLNNGANVPQMFQLVIDNIAMQLPLTTKREMDGSPIQVNGITFFPRYRNDKILRYECQLRNLLLHLYNDCIVAMNSLHKFFAGNNFTDFFLSDIHKAIIQLNEFTGMSWYNATIKKVEIGCNVSANASTVCQGLLSYKTKNFAPMIWKGKAYGKYCEFDNYKVKIYDKGLQTYMLDRVNIHRPLLRYEIVINSPKYFKRFDQSLPVTLTQLIQPDFLQLLMNDAVTIFRKTIKMQKLNLFGLTASEKKSIAAMLIPEIRNDLKLHNKSTYKRDKRIFDKIRTDKTICEDDNTGVLIEQKFNELLNGQKTINPACTIHRIRGHIRPSDILENQLL